MFDSGSTAQFINILALDVIQVLDSRNYFQSVKVNTVPCLCAATLSFSVSN